MILELKRTQTGDTGTFGVMFTADFSCFTIEKPWRDNKPFVSCIPAGMYEVVPFTSKRHPHCYEVTGVEGRTVILFHPANLAGDKMKGLQSELSGCIAPGYSKGKLYGQDAVMKSGAAMDALRAIIDNADSTTLVIEDLINLQGE